MGIDKTKRIKMKRDTMIKLSKAMGAALNPEKRQPKWTTTQGFSLLLCNQNSQVCSSRNHYAKINEYMDNHHIA